MRLIAPRREACPLIDSLCGFFSMRTTHPSISPAYGNAMTAAGPFKRAI